MLFQHLNIDHRLLTRGLVTILQDLGKTHIQKIAVVVYLCNVFPIFYSSHMLAANAIHTNKYHWLHTRYFPVRAKVKTIRLIADRSN
jgi:hypothetical protein